MGTNAQQALTLINDGLGLVEDFQKMTSTSSGSGGAEAQARLIETDARGDAMEAQRKAKKDAERLRDEREANRSRETANWGGANLQMSGSKKLVRDASVLQDKQDEDDVLYEGQRDANAILRQGRNRANMLRINNGGSPNRSTLSMGSKIYGPRR